MKKALSVLLAALILTCALLLSSCGEKTKTGETESAAPTLDDEALNKSFPSLLSFAAGTLDNEEFTEKNFSGHDLTVMNIWATYCGPCLAEMEDIAAFSKALPERVQFITLCSDAFGNEEKARSILEEAGYEGVTLITWDGDLIKLLSKVQYVPTTLFFDGTGRCVGTEIIGGVSDFAAEYTKAVNSALALLGKDAI
ncbi:MAG: TlpA family protein disulfide reductase [Clostridia bacterium]|nr:TlpA family protein disulfide reductase [Clostridia bacterium]